MKLTNIFFAISLAMFVGACSEDVQPNKPVDPTSSADVKFGAALDVAPGSRTIYGDYDPNDKNYPILWQSGDQVKIMANNCHIDQGTYGVNLGKDTPTGANGGTLEKISAAGIQWGDAPTADFFSVYPANHVTTMDATKRTVQCHFIHNQNDTIHYDGTNVTVKADMKAGFLYAATYGAEKGKDVNLLYKPISTGLRFTLNGPTSGDPIQIQRVVLTAPEGQIIAGDFEITFPETAGTTENPTQPTITPTGNNYNFINVLAPYDNTGSGFVSLGVNQKIELNAFLLLNQAVTLSDDWSIGVILSNGKRFIKKLGNTSTADNKKTLVPGKIHRLAANALPALYVPEEHKDYDPADWMKNIARNTYLSEISIPGSWNSMNKDFQTGSGSDGVVTLADLSTQYSKGARAFHLDTRWRANRNPVLGSTLTSGTLTDLAIANSTTSYTCSNGVSNANTSNGDRAMNTSCTTFVDALNTITSLVKENEYMVVFATFAHNSARKTTETWESAVSAACASEPNVIDASKISKTTTVGEVLGKVIVFVMTADAVPTINESKCFFVQAPLKLKSSQFTTPATYANDLLHYGSKASNLYLSVSQCQTEFQSHSGYTSAGNDNSERGYLPTPAARKAQAQAILDWSEANYEKNKAAEDFSHWLFLGLGGYRGAYNTDWSGNPTGDVDAVSGSYASVANEYNMWMYNDIIGKMSTTTATGTTGFYPVGIVLMNFVTNATYGTPVMNAILQLNNRFPLGFNKNLEAWPTPPTNPTEAINFESSVPGYGSGFTADPDNAAI